MDTNAFEHLNTEDVFAIFARALLWFIAMGFVFSGEITVPLSNVETQSAFMIWIILSSGALLLVRRGIQPLSLVLHILDTATLFYFTLYTGAANSPFAYVLPLLVIPAGLFAGFIYMFVAAPVIFVGFLVVSTKAPAAPLMPVAFWAAYYLAAFFLTLLLLNLRQIRKHHIMYAERETAILAMDKRIAELEANLAKQKIEDEVTGLLHFRFFRKLLDDEVNRAKRYKTKFSLCALSVDNFEKFKHAVPTYKHNQIHSEIARCLRGCLRDTDFICKHADDQFFLLMVGSDPRQSIIPTRRIADRMNEITLGVVNVPPLEISFGIAGFPEDTQDAAGIISLASSAQDRSRNRGKNKITLASSLYRKLP